MDVLLWGRANPAYLYPPARYSGVKLGARMSHKTAVARYEGLAADTSHWFADSCGPRHKDLGQPGSQSRLGTVQCTRRGNHHLVSRVTVFARA